MKKTDKGFVYAYRRAWDDPHFMDFLDAAVWNYIYQNAVWEPEGRDVRFNGRTVHVGRGQLLTSLNFLADGFRTTVKVIRGIISRAHAGHMLSVLGGKHGTVLTVCNYDDYQPVTNLEGKPDFQPGHTKGNNTKEGSNKKTLEPDGSREVAGWADDAPAQPDAGAKRQGRKAAAADRQGLGTDAALPGQMPLPGIAEMPLTTPVAAREPVAVPEPVEDGGPELPLPPPPVETPMQEPAPDPTAMQAPAPARPASPLEVGAPPACTVVPMKPKPTEIAEQMRAIWNEECADQMPEARALSAKRVAAMAKALRSHFGNDLEQWRAYCRRLRRSSFMCGDNDRGWIAGIDTCIRADIIIKALEGNYDDREQRHSNSSKELGITTYLKRCARQELATGTDGKDGWGWG